MGAIPASAVVPTAFGLHQGGDISADHTPHQILKDSEPNGLASPLPHLNTVSTHQTEGAKAPKACAPPARPPRPAHTSLLYTRSRSTNRL